jgi:hypothetical protein
MLIGVSAAKALQLLLSTSLARQPSSIVSCSSAGVITLPSVSTRVKGYISEKQHFKYV